jgi:hypothetical protein
MFASLQLMRNRLVDVMRLGVNWSLIAFMIEFVAAQFAGA